MSMVMEVLEGLWNTHLYYKGVKVNMFGVPVFLKNKKNHPENSFQITFTRLRKNGLIEIKFEKWILTEKGKQYFENKNKLYLKFNSPFVLDAPKNLLLMFDIPESRRAERNWLRWHLKEFQYHRLQQSVWVGPSPLPKKFGTHLKKLGLYDCIKTFRLSKPYKISDRKNEKR